MPNKLPQVRPVSAFAQSLKEHGACFPVVSWIESARSLKYVYDNAGVSDAVWFFVRVNGYEAAYPLLRKVILANIKGFSHEEYKLAKEIESMEDLLEFFRTLDPYTTEDIKDSLERGGCNPTFDATNLSAHICGMLYLVQNADTTEHVHSRRLRSEIMSAIKKEIPLSTFLRFARNPSYV